MTFEKKLEERILEIISTWNDAEIYAISFLLTFNQSSTYKGIINFPEFSVGYNTESDCDNADSLSEERWNFANWSQNNIVIIDDKQPEMAAELLQWYENQGIVDIGAESEDNMYDEDCNYVGKGPSGYWELLSLVSDIAKKLQANGTISEHFGRIPIIVHDLEYSWYTFSKTENANPAGEAKMFLEYFLSLSQESED